MVNIWLMMVNNQRVTRTESFSLGDFSTATAATEAAAALR